MAEADASTRAPRVPVDVAVGVLLDAEGRFLLASRPEGKPYAGYWEFPGGKVEPGESVHEALVRELHEELGVTIGSSEAWREEVVDYPHALVRLHFRRVRQWSGAFEMREGQRIAWQTLPVEVGPVLPGTLPVLEWFADERGFTGARTAAARGPEDWLAAVKWQADGLVPVIAQERGSRDVLMFAWMNRQALTETVRRGEAVYWSRSRGRLWHKGEESGQVQRVHSIRMDCDADVLLLDVTQTGHDPGVACHTGRHSCFFQVLEGGSWRTVEPVLVDPAALYRR